MQYWINHNGVQLGPVDLDGLKQLGLTSAAYVWHEGLSDWVKITQLPELQGAYDMVADGTSQPQPASPQGEPRAVAQEPVSRPDEPVVGQPYQPQQLAQQPYQQSAQQPQYAATDQPSPAEPCPPTNLVWAIISTVLCCLPAGIVAIVYATKVTSKYRAGDIEGAKRASETGAWWCIASIVLGILYTPFAMLIQSALMN